MRRAQRPLLLGTLRSLRLYGELCFRSALPCGAYRQVLHGQAGDFGDLGSGGVAAWPEVEAGAWFGGPAIVARDDLVAVCGLYIRIEGVGIRYVHEARRSGLVQIPAGRYHHD